MKSFMIAVIFLFYLFGMEAQANTWHISEPPDTLRFENNGEANDSVTYELIVLDPEFDFWFARTHRGEWYYSQSYLESWNQQLVSQWNSQVGMRTRRGCIPEIYIHYDSHIDYGKALNHKLFYYFRFVQERCRPFSIHPQSWN
jgi:hypothetical protein